MIASIVAIVAYILGSLGFYTIASRRGIKHAWLAWVPVANAWLLGSISDQYQSARLGKRKNKKIALLVLNIVYGLSVAVMVVLCVTLIIQMIALDGGLDFNEQVGEEVYNDAYVEMLPDDFYESEGEELPPELMGTMFGFLGAYLVLLASFIPMMIVQYMALYDVFRSCDPDSSVLYLVLSIFLGISSFLVFACRDKDFGMPRMTPPVFPGYQPPYGGPGTVAYGQPPQPVIVQQEPWETPTE